MNIQFKGLKLGKLIVTTKKTVNDSIKVTMQPKEVFDIFVKAVKDGKITFAKKNK